MFDPFESKSVSPFFTRARLPRRPWCTNDFEYGVQPRRLDIALGRRFIQLNPPGVCLWMMFDIDHSDAARRWHEVGLPPPTWTSCDLSTGKGHAVYGLQYPVRTDVVNKQTRLLAAVEEAITVKLGADRGYAGLMTKNPTAMDKDGRNVWSSIVKSAFSMLIA